MRDCSLTEVLVNDYDYFLNYARKLCGNEFVAEDIVQNAFLKTINIPASAINKKKTWFVYLMRNTYFDYLRVYYKHKIEISYECESIESKREINPFSAVCYSELLSSLERVINQKNSLDQKLFWNFVFKGKNQRLLAIENGISPDAVKIRVHRTRVYLRKILERFVSEK